MKTWKYIFSVVILLLTASQIQAQQNSANSEGDSVYEIVDLQPQFEGMTDGFDSFVNLNGPYQTLDFTHKDHSSGHAIMEGIIEKNGTVTGLKMIHSTGFDLVPLAMNILKRMPPWNPGIVMGCAVRIRIYFDFSLSQGYLLASYYPYKHQLNSVYDTFEESPEFQGGDRAMEAELNKIVSYEGIINFQKNGDLIIRLRIGKKGNVMRDSVINNDFSRLGEKCMSVLNTSQWRPAKINGRPVQADFIVRIQYDKKTGFKRSYN